MGCDCRFDEDGLDGEEDVYFDSNGCLTERVWRGADPTGCSTPSRSAS